jgi:L-ribulose-5-phosphate 4-epimerase
MEKKREEKFMANELEGVIKFQYQQLSPKVTFEQSIPELEAWRKQLFQKKLIGEYLNPKVGYGNISMRTEGNSFIITASGTGGKSDLSIDDYVHVEECSLESFSLKYQGVLPPSSESLTHFSIYQSHPDIRCIFHVHSAELWNYMKDHNFSFVPDTVEYGTADMATFFSKETIENQSGLYVMLGHQDGVLSFAANPQTAGKNLMNLYREAFR